MRYTEIEIGYHSSKQSSELLGKQPGCVDTCLKGCENWEVEVTYRCGSTENNRLCGPQIQWHMHRFAGNQQPELLAGLNTDYRLVLMVLQWLLTQIHGLGSFLVHQINIVGVLVQFLRPRENSGSVPDMQET